MPTITSGAERFLRVAAKNVPLGYEPFPKQRDFHSSPAKYRLFGGAAGPGKTKALLMEAIVQAHEHPGANTLLLRRTFPELEQSLLLYFRRDVPRELYKSFNESKHVVTWSNNSTTRFGYCQSESDVYQYQGAEFLFIGIDELTLFTLRQWQFLTSRNRCPIPNSFPCMAGATNPGNIGHAWVKSLWINKQPAPGMENSSEYDPADYDFISARVSDNPVYAHDENYLKTLRALPTHLRRAFLDGNWDVFAGQYFDNFDCPRHVIRAESIAAEPWYPRWISIDWGFEHPAAVYWHCALPSGSAPTSPPVSSRASPPRFSADDEARLPARQGFASGSRSAGFQPANSCADAGTENRPQDASAIDYLSGHDRWRAAAHSSTVPAASDHVECGGSPPLFAVPANRDVLPAPAKTADSNFGEQKFNASLSPREASLGESCFSSRSRGADSAGSPSSDAAVRSDATAGPGPAHPTAGASSRTPHNPLPQAFVVTYREFVTRHITPRDLAHEILRRTVQTIGRHSERSGPEFFSPAEGGPGRGVEESLFAVRDGNRQGIAAPEKIDAIYLSPDAFAHRTGEASIAEQMGDVFVAAGLPRPIPADDDRIGGWMLMYQMLEATKRGPQVDADQGSRGPGEGRSGDRASLGDQAWVITDNCFELIRTLPSLVRDPIRVEDIEKCDGDDPADAARYGLKSRFAAHRADPGGWRSRMPLADRISAHVYSPDPTIRAMQSRKFTLEESGRIKPPQYDRPRGAKPVKFRHGPHRRH